MHLLELILNDIDEFICDPGGMIPHHALKLIAAHVYHRMVVADISNSSHGFLDQDSIVCLRYPLIDESLLSSSTVSIFAVAEFFDLLRARSL